MSKAKVALSEPTARLAGGTRTPEHVFSAVGRKYARRWSGRIDGSQFEPRPIPSEGTKIKSSAEEADDFIHKIENTAAKC